MAWNCYGITCTGKGRSHNEDSILYPAEPVRLASERGLLVAVADGVGGVPGGSAASRTAIESLRCVVREGPASEPPELLRTLFEAANKAVFELSGSSKGVGPATTLVVGLALTDSVWIGNAGDSRAYALHASAAPGQITEDHCQVVMKPQRLSFVTKALGLEAVIEPDIFGPINITAGDDVLLCSDGLHRFLGKSALANATRENNLSAAAESLVRQAITGGSSDDISVLLLAKQS